MMRQDIYQRLQHREELLRFVRLHPIWYRTLARDPNAFGDLEKQANYFYGKTVPQRIGQFGEQLSMVNMLIQMARAMRD